MIAPDCVNVSEELPHTTMSAGLHATNHSLKPKAVQSACLALLQTRLTACGAYGQIGVHALAHVVAASTPAIAALRLLQKAEARCVRQITAQKLHHATCKAVVQIAGMENGQNGAIGVDAPTLAAVELAGGHERSKPRQMSAVSQQLGSRRSTNSAMKQFHVPRIQTASLEIGVLGVTALVLATE